MLTNTIPKQSRGLLVQPNSPLLKIKSGYGDLECAASKARQLSFEVNGRDSRIFDNTRACRKGVCPPDFVAQVFQLQHWEERRGKTHTRTLQA